MTIQQLKAQVKQDLLQARKDRQARNVAAAKQDLEKVRQDRQQFRDKCAAAAMSAQHK